MTERESLVAGLSRAELSRELERRRRDAMCRRVTYSGYDMKFICTLPKGHTGPCNGEGTR